MPRNPSSAGDRHQVLDRVQQLLAEGRVSLEQLDEELGDLELQLLQQSLPDGVCYPDESYERLCRLIARAEGKPDPPEALLAPRDGSVVVEPGHRTLPSPLTHDSQPPRLATHGTVSHEIRSLRLLFIGIDSEQRRSLCEQLERSSDTRAAIAVADDVREAAGLLAEGRVDAAILDCSRPERGLEQLAMAEVVGATAPVIPLIREDQENQILHLGLREYLVNTHLTPRLMINTLRSAVDRTELMRALAAAQERERFHATRDPMTGLPNRYHFRTELRTAMQSPTDEQVAVIFLDLDRLKQINDTLGHDVGDALITTMSMRIAGALRRGDVVARVGGDEFLLLLRSPEDERASATVATKLLQAIAQPFDVDGDELRVTASIGIALHPRDSSDPEELIRCADAAMYEAKARGRDGYQFYSDSMSAVPRRRLRVEGKMRGAIENEQFEVYFQPRVDVERGVIIGAEALLRWHDPELGSVSPGEFIPIAEENGLIVPLGAWVLDRACREWRRWADLGFPKMRISVNLSARQVRKSDLRESIVQSLWSHDVDPTRLEVEITESALIENQEAAVAALAELSAMGISVALDDFGTGFSSLSYLKRFPVDVIKIDQSFVRDILVDSDDAAIVDAILSIGEKLRLGVVAEGVESLGQRDFLLARGCAEMQGFLFGKPVDAEDFQRLLLEPLMPAAELDLGPEPR